MIYDGILPDRRLARRAAALLTALVTLRTVSIAALARDWAEQMAFYRLIGNKAVTVERLAQGRYGWTRSFRARSFRAAHAVGASSRRPPAPTGASPPHLLLIQDTTEVSFEAHRRRLRLRSGLGWLSNNRQHGYCLHPALVVDAEAGEALGFADVQAWARPPEAPKQAASYRDQPIEEKESFRWIAAMQAAHERLGPGVVLTTVADREADVYSLFARLPEGQHALIRARFDRCIEVEGGSSHLFAHLAAQAVLGEERVWLRGDLRRRTPGRWAHLVYRGGAVRVRRPERSAKPDAAGARDPRSLALWAVEVAERDAPAEGTPVLWRLLRTHEAGSFEQAQQVSTWYRQRWHLEQVFRALKADGLDLERSELETGEHLKRLGVLALGAALEVSRLLLAERGEEVGPIGAVFGEEEQACLRQLNEEVEGRTLKQQNPHEPGTLAWAAWVIARLGGWKGYASQHRAGPATYHRGLQRFHAISTGWRLAHRDVYKP